jgi:competence protein ComEC
MSSPASHHRAPLLWLLCPLMAGLTAAKLWPPPAEGLRPLALFALLAALLALGCAGRTGWTAFSGWALGHCLAIGLGGFLLLQGRYPYLHEAETRPPREITATLRVRQVFPSAARARNNSGLADITATDAGASDLIGRRIYFSVIRKVSVPPQRSGEYVIRGVLEPLGRDPAAAGFNDYLANLGVGLRLTRARIEREAAPPGWWNRFCHRTQSRLEQILHHGLESQPREDSLYVAMLLGAKAELSPEQQNAFMRSGTFHIFSVSGLHVAAIALAVAAVLGLLRMPRRPTVILSLLLLWLYVQVTGGSSPALRSYLMIAFVMGSRFFRLPGNGLAALVAAACTSLVLDPLQLFNPGFQMSYTVVTALILMAVPLTTKWQASWRPFALMPKSDRRWIHSAGESVGRKLIGAGAACWVAFLASTPCGIGYFQLLSPGSLLANLVIIPLSTVAIYAGFVSLLAGLLGLLPLSGLCNRLAAVDIRLMDWLVQQGTALPGMYFPARFAAAWLAPAAIMAMLGLILLGASTRWSIRSGGYWPPALLVVLLLVLGVKFG